MAQRTPYCFGVLKQKSSKQTMNSDLKSTIKSTIITHNRRFTESTSQLFKNSFRTTHSLMKATVLTDEESASIRDRKCVEISEKLVQMKKESAF